MLYQFPARQWPSSHKVRTSDSPSQLEGGSVLFSLFLGILNILKHFHNVKVTKQAALYIPKSDI